MGEDEKKLVRRWVGMDVKGVGTSRDGTEIPPRADDPYI